MPNSEEIKNWLRGNWAFTVSVITYRTLTIARITSGLVIIIGLSIYFWSNNTEDNITRNSDVLHTITLIIIGGIWSLYALRLALLKHRARWKRACVIALIASGLAIITILSIYFGSNYIGDNNTQNYDALRAITLIIIGGIWSLYAWKLAAQRNSTTQKKALVTALTTSGWIIVLSICLWNWLTGGNDDKNNDVLRTITLTIGGIWGLYALWLATQRTKIMQENQISENIGRAAEQLSSDVMSVRILAILSLKKIALTEESTCQSIIRTFCTHIRINHPIDEPPKRFNEDTREILQAISDINEKKKASLYYFDIDLSNINFSYIHLGSSLKLGGVELKESVTSWRSENAIPIISGHQIGYIQGANLMGTNLSGAYLGGTDLLGADLTGVNATKADLTNIKLMGARLWGANLTEADLQRANLTNAWFLENAIGLETVKNPPLEITNELAARDKLRKEYLKYIKAGEKLPPDIVYEIERRKCIPEFVKLNQEITARATEQEKEQN